MSITFRPHRGSLAASMAEAVTVPDRAALVDHLRATHPPFGPAFDASEIVIAPYGCDDERIGWRDIRAVTQGAWGIIGFCTCQ